MDQQKIMSMVDHTLLTQTATWKEIRKICDEGIRYQTASVCIPPFFVERAADYVKGKIKICTVIGFPNGYQTEAVKRAETKDALDHGADEIDMVIHIGDVKEGNYDKIQQEISGLKELCGDHILKVIIETCLLTEEEKIKMCQVVSESGADYIKTSTGFSTEGATFEDIALFQKNVAEHVKIKAAGGISSFEDAEKFIRLGADRLGTSRLVKILEGGSLIRQMIEQAMEARKRSYSPYSNFQVGVCLQGKNGKFYPGCNVENASYPATNCGERTAIFQAVAEGTTEFSRIVIVGGKKDGKLEWCPPCGICRQVMQEFCDPETFEIILAVSPETYEIYLLKDLLPLGFGKENLKK